MKVLLSFNSDFWNFGVEPSIINSRFVSTEQYVDFLRNLYILK